MIICYLLTCGLSCLSLLSSRSQWIICIWSEQLMLKKIWCSSYRAARSWWSHRVMWASQNVFIEKHEHHENIRRVFLTCSMTRSCSMRSCLLLTAVWCWNVSRNVRVSWNNRNTSVRSRVFSCCFICSLDIIIIISRLICDSMEDGSIILVLFIYYSVC